MAVPKNHANKVGMIQVQRWSLLLLIWNFRGIGQKKKSRNHLCTWIIPTLVHMFFGTAIPTFLNNFCYISINSVLSSVITSSDKSSDEDISNFQQTFSIAPGQRLEKQLRFHRTIQKCGRKRKGNILKCSYYDLMLYILEAMVADGAKKMKLLQDLIDPTDNNCIQVCAQLYI